MSLAINEPKRAGDTNDSSYGDKAKIRRDERRPDDRKGDEYRR